MRRRALLAAVAVFLAGAGGADAAAPIATFNAALAAAMRAGRAVPFAQRAAAFGRAVDQAFDLPTILQTSIGPRWSGFSPDQQATLLAAFRDFTIATWVANFDTDNGQKIDIVPDTRKVGADEVVQTRITGTDGETTRLDYVMRAGSAGWRAVDILVDGSISRVAVQRSDFRTLVRGNDPAPLIAMLTDRARELSHGASR